MYTRVHRDKEIVNAMRAWVGLKAIDTSVYTGVEEPAYTSVIV